MIFIPLRQNRRHVTFSKVKIKKKIENRKFTIFNSKPINKNTINSDNNK